MKVNIIEAQVLETEVIIKCADKKNPHIQELLGLLENMGHRIPAQNHGAVTMVEPEQVLYCEFVNRTVFVYTMEEVYPTNFTLAQLENDHKGFFRCSKSMVVNIHQIVHLKSEISGRILTTLSNGEQILVSRHYASSLRRLLYER